MEKGVEEEEQKKVGGEKEKALGGMMCSKSEKEDFIR